MSTWGMRRLYDLAQEVSNLYYRLKYGALAKRIGSLEGAGDRRGLIIVQIDGLAHAHLVEALDSGYMPYLGRLFDDKWHLLQRWNCGLPSATPAIQAGIMFGTRYDIPGFRWYDKRQNLSIVAKRPDQMQDLQKRLRGSREGLLAGGSSYVNLFDGDADLALFTLSALHPHRFFASLKGLGLLLLFLLSPLRLLRVIGMTMYEYARAVARRVLALFRPGVMKPYDLLSPLLAAASEVLFTEVQTFGVMLDIYRRTPTIYTNYNRYDEMAHLMGATHSDSFRVLREVDRRIRQIDRMRTRYRGREYDLYVLSDHGNTPSDTFSSLTGHSLGAFIAAQLGEEVSFGEVFGQASYSLAKASYLLDDLEAASERLPASLQRMLHPVWRQVGRRIPVDAEIEGYDIERRDDIVVRASGPLAHVYFDVTRRQLDLVEVALLYPQLIGGLLESGTLGLIAGRAGERVVALGPDMGMAIISLSGLKVEGANPLQPFGEVDWVAGELRRVVSYPRSGDLVLLGKMQPDGSTVSFEEQTATHGGLGGPQSEPFIATPNGIGAVPGNGPEQLYDFFWSRYRI